MSAQADLAQRLTRANPVSETEVAGAASGPAAIGRLEAIIADPRGRSARPALAAVGRVARLARRPLGLLATAGAFGGIAVLFGLLIVAGPSHRDPATRSLRPDLSSLTSVRTCSEPRLRAPCVVGTPRVRAATPALYNAPWLYSAPARRLGAEPPRPSLVFPPGTTYAQGLDALYVSVVLTGGLPVGTTLGPPLPQGAVLLQPTDPAEGIAIDLRAPLGYTPPQGGIYHYVLSGPSNSRARGHLWRPGFRIAVPTLPPCMIISSRSSLPPACGPSDDPVLGEPDPSIAPLPEVAVSAAGLIEAGKRVAIPALTLPTVRAADGIGPVGAKVDLASLRGRVVVVGLFASWCTPCRAQVRTLENTARNWRGGDLTILGITVQDLTSDARRFMAKHSFPALTDGKVVAAAALGAAAVPTTVLIDKQGRIALSVSGSPRSKQLDEGIAELLAEAP